MKLTEVNINPPFERLKSFNYYERFGKILSSNVDMSVTNIVDDLVFSALVNFENYGIKTVR